MKDRVFATPISDNETSKDMITNAVYCVIEQILDKMLHELEYHLYILLAVKGGMLKFSNVISVSANSIIVFKIYKKGT